ncbi:hypothetical protein N7454_005302 [Penicillium verhagenii]|nr:hypothetical protein N7454_005302 [Penicillium verhagenii]
MSFKSPPSIPTLEDKHNGTPARLLHKAYRAKGLIQDIATKEPQARKRLPISRELGNENVEINDKPLDDGW